MEIKYYHKSEFVTEIKMFLVPRKNEKIMLFGNMYIVEDIVYVIQDKKLVEIQIMLGE